MPSWDHSIDYRDWKLVITGNILLGVCASATWQFQTTCPYVVVGMLTANNVPHTGSYSGLHEPALRKDMCIANK